MHQIHTTPQHLQQSIYVHHKLHLQNVQTLSLHIKTNTSHATLYRCLHVHEAHTCRQWVCVWSNSTHTRGGGVHMLQARYLFISSNCSRVDRSSRRLICLWQWVQKNSSASDWRKLWKLAGKKLGLRRPEERRNKRRGEDTMGKWKSRWEISRGKEKWAEEKRNEERRYDRRKQ